MPPGGYRTAAPGEVHPNRSDLSGDATAQPVRATKAKVYGDRQRQENAQSVIPLPTNGPKPGSLTPLTAGTERPHEPVTAGLPIGPGPGPDTLVAPSGGSDALFDLRALAARFPQYQDLYRIIALAEQDK